MQLIFVVFLQLHEQETFHDFRNYAQKRSKKAIITEGDNYRRRYFVTSHLFPFLWIGPTTEIFHEVGNLASCRDFEISLYTDFDEDFEHFAKRSVVGGQVLFFY